MEYEIITDSSANLTNEVVEEYNLNIIPLIFISDGKEYVSYQKNLPIDLKEFYTMLRDKKHFSTSAINKQSFYNSFEEILKRGKDMIYIGFSSALSVTYCNAEKAAEELRIKYPDRKIYCINTLGASLGEGLIVLYAARLKQEGKSIDEVLNWVDNNRLNLCHYFTVDDLYYLFKGGRVTKSKYFIANIMKIKPILHMDDFGRLIPIGKVIGRRKSLSTLAEMLVENIKEPENQTICISHGDCIEDAEYLKTKIESKIKVKEFIINYVDPVIGAHSGPGTVAVFFLGHRR